jgi:hypothetical protein
MNSRTFHLEFTAQAGLLLLLARTIQLPLPISVGAGFSRETPIARG